MHLLRSRRMTLAGALAIGTVICFSGVVIADSDHHGAKVAAARQQDRNTTLRSSTGTPDGDLADQQAQYANERTAPGLTLPGDPLLNAAQQGQSLQTTGGAWQEMTNQPYNAEPSNYTDPFWSNIGAGFSLVGGRTTALAQTPDGAWFAGAADGGVWKSTDQGQHWTPLFDKMASLSIGALAVNPVDGSLWVGTGGANVSQDSYQGIGVYRTSDGGTTFSLVGPAPSPLVSRTTFRLAFDSAGNAYAATDHSLLRLAGPARAW